jgi:ABC-type glycerol-3-phosphate transport system permease component
MPLSKTALLTVGMIYALFFWNDWRLALFFVSGNRDLYPLQYYLYALLSNIAALNSGRVPSSAMAHIRLPAETARMAVTIITIGPIILLYPFIQRFFISNIMSGAVKE